MSTPEIPRTCTLYGRTDQYADFHGDVGVRGFSGTPLQVGEAVEFEEKAPVDAERERLLDLLENLGDFLDTVTQWTGSDPDELHEHLEATDAALREYGRLGEEES